jgi:integrase
LRWSDIINLDRQYVIANQFINFDVAKTKKRQTIAINQKALAVLKHCPEIFVHRPTDIHVNREIKKIARQLGIKKKISFHVARHTFATNFLRMGGNLVKLQMILGHSNIRETMIYVHIVEQEANDEMALMDKLF